MGHVRDEVVAAAQRVMQAADAGDGESATGLLEEHRLLCAHREGRFGVGGWNRLVERLLAERNHVSHYDEWYVGRPVLVTANDRGLGLSNGDLGVTVRDPRRPAPGGRADRAAGPPVRPHTTQPGSRPSTR